MRALYQGRTNARADVLGACPGLACGFEPGLRWSASALFVRGRGELLLPRLSTVGWGSYQSGEKSKEKGAARAPVPRRFRSVFPPFRIRTARARARIPRVPPIRPHPVFAPPRAEASVRARPVFFGRRTSPRRAPTFFFFRPRARTRARPARAGHSHPSRFMAAVGAFGPGARRVAPQGRRSAGRPSVARGSFRNAARHDGADARSFANQPTNQTNTKRTERRVGGDARKGVGWGWAPAPTPEGKGAKKHTRARARSEAREEGAERNSKTGAAPRAHAPTKQFTGASSHPATDRQAQLQPPASTPLNIPPTGRPIAMGAQTNHTEKRGAPPSPDC